jgi:hypothetical protein
MHSVCRHLERLERPPSGRLLVGESKSRRNLLGHRRRANDGVAVHMHALGNHADGVLVCDCRFLSQTRRLADAASSTAGCRPRRRSALARIEQALAPPSSWGRKRFPPASAQPRTPHVPQHILGTYGTPTTSQIRPEQRRSQRPRGPPLRQAKRPTPWPVLVQLSGDFSIRGWWLLPVTAGLASGLRIVPPTSGGDRVG